MTQTRAWMLMAVLSVVLVGSEGQAAAKKKTQTDPEKTAEVVRKTYSVAGLIDPAAAADETEMFVKFVMKAVKPTSWKCAGGCGTVQYDGARKCLVVHQTPAVQAQVGCLLKALVTLKNGAEKQDEMRALVGAARCLDPMIAPAAYPSLPPPPPCPAVKAPAGAKQYGHFVMDDIKVNAMGVSTTIKKIKFMYKGDGIEADVAKCAMTNGESEHKGDVEKLISEVSKLIEKKEADKSEPCGSNACVGATSKCPAAAVPVGAVAETLTSAPTICPPCPPVTTCTPVCCPCPCTAECPKCEKVEEKKDKPAEPKQIEKKVKSDDETSIYED